MPFPFVSRERYDEKCAELRALREQYDAMLREHAAAQPVTPRREPRPAKPVRDPMVDRMAADLEATLGDPVKARAEAERLKREAFGGPL